MRNVLTNAMRISVSALIVGLLIDQLATIMLVTLATSGWVVYHYGLDFPEGVFASPFASPGALLVLGGLGAACSVLGGYAAGRVAGRLELLHAALVGAGDVVVGLASKVLPGEPTPLWYDLPAFLAVVPAAMLGGYLAKRSREAVPD